MPLLNGQRVNTAAAGLAAECMRGQQPKQAVTGWRIRFTGEEFSDYEKYLERMTLYRKRQWTCSETGQTGLSFEQAQLSERAAQHRSTGIGFSDMLICEMLTFLSQSTLPISMAVDALYYRFQYDFFNGEHIDVRYPGTNGAMYECFVVGMGPLSHVEQDIESEDVPETTRIAIERLGEAASFIVAYEQRKRRLYTVRLYDVDGKAIDGSDISVPASELSRSRNMFTKVSLRQFLDGNMQREARPGSPWVVGAEWRERFRIPFMYGGEARQLRTSRGVRRVMAAETAPAEHSTPVPSLPPAPADPYADERQLAVKMYRKVPMDDLDLLQLKHVKWGKGVVWALRRKKQRLDKKNSVEEAEEEEEEEEDLRHMWPVPSSEWQVPLGLVSRMLSVYMFVSCFSAPLGLQTYSLDYFESSLVHQEQREEDAPRLCSVYRETMAALLNSLIDDRQASGLAPGVGARIEAMEREFGSDGECMDEDVLAAGMAELAVERLGVAGLRRAARTWAQTGRLALERAAWGLAGWVGEARFAYAGELGGVWRALCAGSSVEQALGSVDARLAVLEALVSESASNTRMRAFLDACSEQAAELKRERLEARRELKRAAESAAELPAEGAGEPSESLSREETRRAADAAAQSQRDRRRLGEVERVQARRVAAADRELRRCNVARLAPLGTDRFLNRYYFIDGVAGCPAVGANCGRVLVQPPDAREQADALAAQPALVAAAWALAMPRAWTGGLAVPRPDQELRSGEAGGDEEGAGLARAGHLWAYYAAPTQIDALRRWLDPRGRREAALLAELDLQQSAVAASLRRRCVALEQAHAARAAQREAIGDQITMAAEGGDEVTQLQNELARIDAAPMPRLPAAPDAAASPASASASCSSSRASSAEPVASVSRRGRRPKARVAARGTTYMDGFLGYANTRSPQ
ncbi:hypothetical protein H4R26_004058 [Coemansia thaxteri]|uniref:WAC domain-containing protein n=1 Tax=Coemansia thaxteri TaxID=2663907 RepID=A0A9W8EE07_9FUNG|nr:hypothetical protein H4R26_004058 [Coemansia thaxteri]